MSEKKRIDEVSSSLGTDKRDKREQSEDAEKKSGDEIESDGDEQGEGDEEDDDSVEIPPIALDCHVFEIVFHPTRPLLAVALITGTVQIYEIKEGHTEKIMESKHHTKSCRTVAFGSCSYEKYLFSGCADGSVGVFDIDANKVVSVWPKVHGSGVNIVRLYKDQLLVSGDDDGYVKVWDLKKLGPIKFEIILWKNRLTFFWLC